MMGGGLCWLDFDGDGWLDLYAVNSYALDEAGRWQQGASGEGQGGRQESAGGLPRNGLFRNVKGKFSDVSAGSGADVAVRGNGCVAADLDLDGWTDLYVTTSRFNVLLWNNGDGTFTEGGEAAGADTYGWQSGAAVGDFNDDGWPDIFVAGYVDINSRIPEATLGFPNTHFGLRDQLYLNEGPGPSGRVTFREVGVEAGLEAADYEYGLGAILSDLDGDGDLDLFVANDTNPNRLYENVAWPGGPEADPEGIGFRFAEVGQYAQIADTNSGMGVASADYDNDGRFDLVATNLGHQLHSVYLNQSSGDDFVFEDATGKMGVADIGVGWTGWGISWADVDLDTDLDLIIANGTVPVLDLPDDVQQIQFFSNLTAQGMTGLFLDLTEVAGFNEIDPLLARGGAVADYDNDGDVDIAINVIGGRLVLLRNDNVGGNWLAVQLEGFQPGALVTVVLPDGRELLCETHAGSSYLSSEDPRCHFGLGAATEVDEVRVRWPGGAETRLSNLPANQLVDVAVEADSRVASNVPAIDPEEFLFQIMLKDGGARPMQILPAASPEMISLGEALFWDREFSGNRDVSCAPCHHPLAATGDDLSVSIGVGGQGFAGDRQLGEGRDLIPRNAPEIFNRGADGWHTMFWDGRVSGGYDDDFTSPAGDSLPQGLENVVAVQAMFPVTSREEMRGDEGDFDVFGKLNELALLSDDDLRGIWAGLMDRLLAIEEYQELFTAAYPDIPLEWLRFQQAANAMAAYEMALFTQADSPWDRFLAGDQEALSAGARQGAFLFYGDAGCSRCHNGSLLTDQEYHNIGVPQIGPGKGGEAPLDFGRGRVSGQDIDRYAFRTPPLRNVAVTGPWMHNGAYTTLEAAVRHHLDPVSALESYDAGQLDPMVRDSVQSIPGLLTTLDPLVSTPLELTDQEVADLLLFLQALGSPPAEDACALIPDSVPSGLPVDDDPEAPC
jgi:cytochrome c peroxidase